MAIIPNDEINNIRNNSNIVDIISSYVNLEPHGKNYFGICPFHDDHTPSMSVSEDKQIYKCFVCGNTGNVFTFVKNIENVDFVSAVKIVADKIGYNLKVDTSVNNPNKKYYEIMDLANKYFINNINSSIGLAAKEYLIKERKLDEQTIEQFKIAQMLSSKALEGVFLNGIFNSEFFKEDNFRNR